MNDDVKPFLVPQTHTIRQAMEQLEKTEEKILFVVEGDFRLIGSLTDGDIRRWILSDGDLKAQVFRVCNRNPYVAEEGFATAQVRADMLNGNLELRSRGQSLAGDRAAGVLEGTISRRGSNQAQGAASICRW